MVCSGSHSGCYFFIKHSILRSIHVSDWRASCCFFPIHSIPEYTSCTFTYILLVIASKLPLTFPVPKIMPQWSCGPDFPMDLCEKFSRICTQEYDSWVTRYICTEYFTKYYRMFFQNSCIYLYTPQWYLRFKFMFYHMLLWDFGEIVQPLWALVSLVKRG